MASALKFGTSVRNTLANSITTIWNSGILKIYDAVPPTNPQASYTGNLLAAITAPTTAFISATSGTASKAGTWSCTSVLTSGTAAGFRLSDSSTTAYILDGSVGLAGTDMILDNVNLIEGGTVTVNSFTIIQPE
jgi:hypothetical protein